MNAEKIDEIINFGHLFQFVSTITYGIHILCLLFLDIYLYKKTKAKYFLYIPVFWLFQRLLLVFLKDEYEFLSYLILLKCSDLLTMLIFYYVIAREFYLMYGKNRDTTNG